MCVCVKISTQAILLYIISLFCSSTQACALLVVPPWESHRTGIGCNVGTESKIKRFSHRLPNITSTAHRQQLSSQLEPGGANGRLEKSHQIVTLSVLLTGVALANGKQFKL